MVAIVSGNNLGLNLSSLSTLGLRGAFGNASQGQNGEMGYVNIATGNLVLQDKDGMLMERGDADIPLLRTYNSQGLLNDDNGDNWSNGIYRQQLQVIGMLMTAGSQVVVTGRDGSQQHFQFDQTQQAYVSREGGGAFDLMTYDAVNGRLSVVDGDTQSVDTYEASGLGRLLSSADRNGTTITCNYNAGGLIASMTAANGDVIEYDYTGTNLTQIRILPATGGATTIRYSYDAQNRLSSVTQDLTPEDGVIADGNVYATTYTYDGTSNRIVSVAQSDGGVIQFSYIQAGGQYKVASSTDALGNVTTYAYDTAGRKTTVTDPMGLETVYRYDAAGQLIKVTPPIVDGKVISTRFVYDASGNVSQVAQEDDTAPSAPVDSIVVNGVQMLLPATDFPEGKDSIASFSATLSNGASLPWWGFSIDSNTGEISHVGTYPTNVTLIKVTAHSKSGAVTDVIVPIAPPSPSMPATGLPTSAPPIPDQVVGVGQAFQIPVPAGVLGNSDFMIRMADGSYPSWIHFNPSTGNLEGYASAENVGEIEIVFVPTSSDGTGISQTMSMHIRVENYPISNAVTTPTNAYVQVGSPSDLPMPSNWFSSPDDMLMGVTLADGSPLPNWLVPNLLEHRLIGFPPQSETASLTLRLEIVDTLGTKTYKNVTVVLAHNFGPVPEVTTTDPATGIKTVTLRSPLDGKLLQVATYNMYTDKPISFSQYQLSTGNLVLSINYSSDPNDRSVSIFDGNTGNLVADAYFYADNTVSATRYAYYSSNPYLRLMTETVNLSTGRLTTGTTYDDSNFRTSLYQSLPNGYNAYYIQKYVKGQSPYTTWNFNATTNNFTSRSTVSNGQTIQTETLNGQWIDIRTLSTDGYGRTVALERYDASTKHLQLFERYDNSGNLISRASWNPATGLPLQQLYWTGYGALTGQADYDPVTGKIVAWKQWSADGNHLLIEDDTWDASGILTAKRYLAYFFRPYLTEQATYSASGQITDRTTWDRNSGEILRHESWNASTKLYSSYTEYDYVAKQVRTAQFDTAGHPTGVECVDLNSGETIAHEMWGGDGSGNASAVTTIGGLRYSGDFDAAGKLIDAEVYDTVHDQVITSWDLSVTDGQAIDLPKIDFSYDAQGNPISQRDSAGNVITWTYDSKNRMTTETRYAQPDPDGAGSAAAVQPQTTRYVYEDAAGGQLRFKISPESRVTDYRYDEYGQRTQIVQYMDGVYDTSELAVGATADIADLAVWSASQNPARTQQTMFYYDVNGQVWKSTAWGAVDAAGNGVAGTKSEVQYTYDPYGRLLSSTDALGGITTCTYDGLGRQLSLTNSLGQLTVTSYDDANGKASVTSSNGLTVTSMYDPAGHLIAVVQSDASHTIATTHYSYDADGRLVMTEDPTGVRSWNVYDDQGRKVGEIDGAGHLVEFMYDEQGRVIHTLRHYNLVNLHDLVDASGLPLPLTLDAIRPEVDPYLGKFEQKTWSIYDTAGRLLETIDGAPGAATVYQYDGLGQLVKTVQYATLLDTAAWGDRPPLGADLVPESSSEDRITRNFYGKDSELLATLSAEGELVEWRYDGAGDRIGSISYATRVADGLRGTATLDQLRPADSAADIVTATIYNGKEHPVGDIDGEGYLTEYVYDQAGNLTQTIRYATRLTLPVAAAGASIADLRPAPSPTDQTVSTVYDLLHRPIQKTDAEGGITQYRYDSDGNLVQTIQAVGRGESRSLTTRYDVQGRVVAELSGEGSALMTGNQTQAQIDAIWTQYGVTYDYDATGRRTVMINTNGGRTLYYYDAAGQQIYVVNPLGGVTKNVYNNLGQLTQTVMLRTAIDPSALHGGIVASEIAMLDQQSASNLDYKDFYSYDVRGNLINVSDGVHSTDYQYNAFGEVISEKSFLRSQTYTYDLDGRRTGANWIARFVSDASRVEEKYSYDAFGRIIETTDGNGYVTKQQYDKLGRVVQVVDPSNATRMTTYDPFNRISTQTDALGHVTQYAYSLDNRGVTVTSPEGITLTTVHDALGQTISVTDGRGETTQYRYDHDGHLIQTDDALTQTKSDYNSAGQLIDTIDANGNKTAYTYDAVGRILTRRLDPDVLNLTTQYVYDAEGRQIETIDPEGVVTRMEYDSADEMIRSTVDPDGLALTTSYRYDYKDKVTSVTRPDGSQTLYEYDEGGRLWDRSEVSGLYSTTTFYYYDAGNNVTHTSTVVSLAELRNVRDDEGNIIGTTAVSSSKWQEIYATSFYDADGRPILTVDGQGNVHRTEYDAAGEVLRSIDYAKPIDVTQFISSFVFTEPTLAQVEALLVPDPANDRQTISRYDDDGRLTWKVDSQGAVTHLVYDANGNVVERIMYATPLDAQILADLQADAIGSLVPMPAVDTAHDAHIVNQYDALNRLTYSADAAGAVTRYDYDGNGNVIRQVQYATPSAQPVSSASDLSAVSASAGDRIAQTIYDAANRPQWQIDAAGVVSRLVYDPQGNVVQSTTFAKPIDLGALGFPATDAIVSVMLVPSSQDRVIRRSFDAAGRPVYQVDAMGYVTQDTYDAAGDLTKTIHYAKPVTAPVGPLTTAQIAALIVTDAGDQRQDMIYGTAHHAAYTIDGMGYVVHNEYDEFGNIIGITSYGELVVDRAAFIAALANPEYVLPSSYDDRTSRYAFDLEGHMLQATDALGNSEHYTYDALGNRLSFTDKLGAQTIYAYDVSGHLISTTDALGNVESSTYDALGNKASQTNKLGGVTIFTYDAQGRQISETLPVTSTAANGSQIPVVNRIQYDAFGNRIETIEAEGLPEQRTTSYTYNTLNHQVTKSGDPVTIYVVGQGWVANHVPVETNRYDAFGNLIEHIDANGNHSRTYYDAANHAIADVSATGTLTLRQFDGAGNVTATRMYGDPVSLPAGDTVVVPTTSNYRELRYVYDAVNQRIETIQANVNFAEQNQTTGNFTYAVGDVVQYISYNANGQVVSTQDGIGNHTYTYYDKLGHKVLSIDAEGYATQFVNDALGNVVEEKAFANKVPVGVPYTESSDPATLIAAIVPNAKDRVTDRTYDDNGRLLSEIKRGVANAVVNTTTGQLTEQTSDATTLYSYDAAGDTTSKTDANGNVSNWQYDVLSRNTAILLPTATDYLGNAVRQTTNYQYNGLNLVTRETQVGSGADADHVILHQYGAGGLQTAMTTATGEVIHYGYDANGNATAQITNRLQADGTIVHDMLSVTYDAANREIKRFTGAADQNDMPVWNIAGETSVQYNAYGDLVGKTTAGGNATGQPQEFYDYDSAGRVWRSNSGDGITKAYLYDRDGRATMMLESQTMDLRNMSLNQILTQANTPNSAIAETITVYGARGETLSVIQPKMDASRPNVVLVGSSVGIQKGSFDGVQLVSGNTLLSAGNPILAPAPVVTDTANVSGNLVVSAQANFDVYQYSETNSVTDNVYHYWGATATGINFTLPDFTAAYGPCTVTVQFYGQGQIYDYGVGGWVNKSVAFTGGNPQIFTAPGHYSTSFDLFRDGWTYPTNFDGNWSMQVTVKPLNGTDIIIGSLGNYTPTVEYIPTVIDSDPDIGWYTYNTEDNIRAQLVASPSFNAAIVTGGSNQLRLDNQTLQGAANVDLYYRANGSTGAYTKLPAHVLSGQSGTYVADMTGLNGTYDMLMVATDSAGHVLRNDKLVVSHSASGGSVTRTSGVTNSAVFTPDNVMHLTGLQTGNGHLATSLTYTPLPSGSPVTINARNGIPGLFDIPVTTGAAQIVLTDAAGNHDNIIAQINTATASATFQAINTADSTLVFRNLSSDATTLTIQYRAVGSSTWLTRTLTRPAGSSADWVWDTQGDGLVPDRTLAYQYEVNFDAFDSDGTKVNNGTATITAGAIPGGTYVTPMITGSAKPRLVTFAPTQTTGNTLQLRYRIKGSQDDFQHVTLTRLASGVFKFDASALDPTAQYEYAYDVVDGTTVVGTSTGYFKPNNNVNDNSGNVDIQWIIPLDGSNQVQSEHQIVRSQTYDAFGDVISETDGNGNTTNFEYNALGKLTVKRDPATDITLNNGYIQHGVQTQTKYYYDLTGAQVGTLDANGNLNTQIWNIGGANANIAKEWHADGGGKSNLYDVFGNLRATVNEDQWRTEYVYDKNNRLIRMDSTVSVGVVSSDSYEYDVSGQRIAHTNGLGYRDTTQYDSLGRVIATTTAEGKVTSYAYTYDNTIGTVGTAQAGGWHRTMTDANGNTMVDDLDIFNRVLKHTDLGGHVFTYTYNWAGLIASQRGTSGQSIDYTYYGNGYLKNQIDNGIGATSTYEYDNNGNRTFEGYLTNDGTLAFQQETTTYDAMSRVTHISDPRYQITYEYDAVGNRRRVDSVYSDGVGGNLAEQDYWYSYDSMNRFTISMGQLSGARGTSATDTGTQVIRGATGDGVQLAYTQAGLRYSASYAQNADHAAHDETYYYDGRGLLTNTYLSDGTWANRTNDLAGRVTDYKVTESDGTVLQHSVRTWDKDNHMIDDYDQLGDKGTHYELMADGTMLASQTYATDPDETTIRTTYQYQLWDNAKQSSITIQAKSAQVDEWNEIWQPGFSQFGYDVNGHNDYARDVSGNRSFHYWTDADGQVLKRDELIGGSFDPATGTVSGASKNRQHNYYYFDGHRVGDVGNDSIERVDYAQELANVKQGGSERSYEKFTPTNAADFDQNYEPINGSYPGGASTVYTVRNGDTLSSVARALWGDAGLWYLLADANGLLNVQPGDALTANSTLVVPNKVTNIHNTSQTFKAYDPGLALGDTSPTLPAAPPPPAPADAGGGCGGAGMIIMIVVAVVATIVTAGAAAAALGVSGGLFGAGTAVLAGTAGLGMTGVAIAAGAAAVGSIASQVVGMAIGAQSGFSWKAVGQSALVAGVTAGIGSELSSSTSTFSTHVTTAFNVTPGVAVSQAVTVGRAAIGSVLTQGVMMAIGQQSSFDWRGVVASAASAFSGKAASGMGRIGSGIASGIGGALAYGGNLRENSTSIIGNVIGSTIAENLGGPSRSELELQLQEDARDAAIFQAIGNSSPALGNGLRATQDQAAAFGPSYAAEHDFSNQRSDVLVNDSRIDVTKSGDTLTALFNKNYGYTPSPTELIQYANYNNLSSAHDISENREIVSPSLDELSQIPVNDSQRNNYLARDGQYQALLQQRQDEAQQIDTDRWANALRDPTTGEPASFFDLSMRSRAASDAANLADVQKKNAIYNANLPVFQAWDGKPGTSPSEQFEKDFASAYYRPMVAPVAVAGGYGVSTAALIGGATGGILDAAGQYQQNNEIRFGEVAAATVIGAVSGVAGARTKFWGNVLLAGTGNAALTQFSNNYYGENNNLYASFGVGALFGVAGYATGFQVANVLGKTMPAFVYPTLNTKVPVLFQGMSNNLPSIYGNVFGSVVSNFSSFVPPLENSK